MRGRVAGFGATAAVVTAIAAVGGMAATASASVAKPVSADRASVVAVKSAASAPATYVPPKRNLTIGMKGADVKALQERLAALKYYPGTEDGTFGSDTQEAVWAFQEVNRLSVDGVVGPATKKALVHPRTYTAEYPNAAGTRVEINLGMGVLVFFKNHQIALISHESSAGHYYFCQNGQGCNNYAITPTGEFQAYYFVPGWDHGPLGAMYNPVFFDPDQGDAIHGEYNSEVPVKPVSHGCVRIPFDIATWFYKDLTTSWTWGKGTQVWVYNQW